MGKYGLKIRNYEAASICEYKLGLRDYYDYQEAMLTNSLFLDYLYEIGIETIKDTATRDIVCMEFGYGTRTYKEHLKKLTEMLKIENLNEDPDEEKIEWIQNRIDFINMNKDKYEKRSNEDIRCDFYQKGVDIQYMVKNSRGVLKPTVIHYKMLFRTPGKAKNGSCMFINERLYDKALKFIRMGIELPEFNAPIVEIGAYSPLVTSTIIDKIKINPKNILILKDVDSFFETKVVSIETDENKHCYAKKIDKYRLKNTLFDGQALIDSSIFPKWGNGFILLRHHFCKMAAFCTHIQKFFKDYYGDKYLTATVKDMFGNEHYVKDIELITTENAMKWLKFEVSYEDWCERVYENGCMFGIVKTAHQSKLGDVQKMSYQMVNALDLKTMDGIVETSRNYIELLKKDDREFIKYLKLNKGFANDYEVIAALYEQDKTFARSEYFRERKNYIVSEYVKNFKRGKVIQNADNLVIVGSPYAMLLHSVGENVDSDDTFSVEDGAIQCFTTRFENGEYLAEFRSPFNSPNNLGHLHNVYHEKMFKYFDFGQQIIAVNMIGTDFQDRNNGSDQDSDQVYVTNQIDIVNHAKHCYSSHPTIVNNIPKEKNNYNNTLLDFATIDNTLAAANMAIGESSNLAQIALTYTYNYNDQKYVDAVCILSVLAQIAIDNAKRSYDINLVKEIARIKGEMNLRANGIPVFFDEIKKKNIKRLFSTDINNAVNKKIFVNKDLICPMNYLKTVKINHFKPKESVLPMNYFFINKSYEAPRKTSKKVEELIEKYSLELFFYNTRCDKNEELLLREDFEQLIEDIRMTNISKSYAGVMSYLLNRALLITPTAKGQAKTMQTKLYKNRSLLMKVLYEVNKEVFMSLFKKNVN